MEIREAKKKFLREKFPLNYEPKEWEAYKEANCYPYAIGLKTNENFLIGDFIDCRMTRSCSIESILDVLQLELEALGFEVEECETEDSIAKGFKIYLKFDAMHNYHFLRQDSDGLWSHKASGRLPNRNDTAGYEIEDPDAMCDPPFEGYCFHVTPRNFET